MSRRRSDAIVAITVAVLGAIALIGNFTVLPDGLGGRYTPAAVGAFLLVLGGVLAALSYRRRGQP